MNDEHFVYVIDDDGAIRDSLGFLLEVAGHSARTFDSAVDFLEALPTLKPGCIVTDVRMPEMSGLELVRRLNELGSKLPVIVMTGHADVPLAVEAMKAGVVDFVEKPFDDEQLLRSIGVALRKSDESLLQDEERQRVEERLASLSAREREVLDRLVAGAANKVIAYDLGISPRTVEVYRANVMTKMRAASLSELVRLALSVGRGPTNS